MNLKSEADVLRGVLWQYRGSWLVLRDAEVLRDGHAPARLDGAETVIHRSNVSYLQVIT